MSGYRILVVDDDPAQRDLLQGYLELAGYSVSRAACGAEALACVADSIPDLMLLDIQMPEIDGLEVLRRLRSRAETRDVPVLLLSAVDRAHVRVRGLELGADDYISKTCERPELLARVRAGLRRGQRYRKAEHALAGNLDDMGLEVLLQTLQIGVKSGRVELPEMGAVVTARNGALRSCSYLRFEGSAALERVFLMARGRFYVTLTSPEDPAEDHDTALSLVGALVAVDEVRQKLADKGQSDAIVQLGPIVAPNPALERLRSSFPLSLLELIVSMDGSVVENAGIVAVALDEGQLVADD